MSLLNNPLAGMFLVVMFLGIFSGVFFKVVPMRVDSTKKGVMNYFMMYFVCSVLACIFYIIRSFFSDQMSTIINGILYLTAMHCLRHGFLLRKYPNHPHLHKSVFYWVSIILLVLINGIFLHKIYPDFGLRIVFVDVMMSIISLSILPLVTLESKSTNGEKILKNCLIFLITIFISLPLMYALTMNVKLFVFCTIVVQALSAHIFLGSLCALMMSDVIKMHYKNSVTDALTGMYNRRYFMEHASQVSEEATENALVICDLDDFKRINDTYGHKDGDKAIIAFAQMLKNNISKTDMVARIGGEEFAVLLNNVSFEEAEKVANRLCQLTKEIALTSHNQQPFALTASFGICKFGKGITLDDAFHGADQALYRSKESGKSQVQVFYNNTIYST